MLEIHRTECIVLGISALVASKWIRLVFGIRVSLMEVCLHVLLWKGSEQRLGELDVLGFCILQVRMQVSMRKLGRQLPNHLGILAAVKYATHPARIVIQHD